MENNGNELRKPSESELAQIREYWDGLDEDEKFGWFAEASEKAARETLAAISMIKSVWPFYDLYLSNYVCVEDCEVREDVVVEFFEHLKQSIEVALDIPYWSNRAVWDDFFSPRLCKTEEPDAA